MQELMEIFNIFNPLTLELVLPKQRPFSKNFELKILLLKERHLHQ